MDLVTELTGWRVRLHSGVEVELWADGYSEEGGHHLFGVLADVPLDEQQHLRILGETPDNPLRVIVALASIPTSEIETVLSL